MHGPGNIKFHVLFMGAFMYVVRVSKQTAIISVDDINWVGFITQYLLRSTN
jgi:hypothetical protein